MKRVRKIYHEYLSNIEGAYLDLLKWRIHDDGIKAFRVRRLPAFRVNESNLLDSTIHLF